jgi:hypothetical protein
MASPYMGATGPTGAAGVPTFNGTYSFRVPDHKDPYSMMFATYIRGQHMEPFNKTVLRGGEAKDHMPLTLMAEPENTVDPSAVMVLDPKKRFCGYVDRQYSAHVAGALALGVRVLTFGEGRHSLNIVYVDITAEIMQAIHARVMVERRDVRVTGYDYII